MAITNENPAQKEPQKADCPSASCCASLVWDLRGEEWHADHESGMSYTVMHFDGRWHAFIFWGTKYKRGETLSRGGLQTADDAKQVCEKHHHQ
jgi:hypothetical protein